MIALFFSGNLHAQKSYNEKQLEVSLRTIGHQLLQKSGDSSSRVLPVTKEGKRYKIEFENDFNFTPDSLFRTVSNVISQANFTNAFIVEVEDCTSGDVVYIYEIDSASQLELLPCGGRDYPTACYNIFFTIKEMGVTYPMQTVVERAVVEKSSSNIMYYGAGLLAVIFLAVFFFFKKRKEVETYDPNIMNIGEYKFDIRNSTLYLNTEKEELSGKESELLLLLYENLNQTIERDIILQKVWGDEGDYIGRTLDVFISKLRKKLEGDPNIKIVNIRGVGYRLVE